LQIKFLTAVTVACLLIGSAFYLAISLKQDTGLTLPIREETVERVIDGDTIVLTNGEVVRYLDIDTPETVHPTKPVQCYGPESTERNRELVEGRIVQLDVPAVAKDNYGRTLAYVYADDDFVNGELVWEGYAYAQSYGQPGRLYPTLIRMEKAARESQKGLWESCQP